MTLAMKAQGQMTMSDVEVHGLVDGEAVDEFWDVAAAWEDGEDEIARTVDLERKQFDTVKVIERATKQEIGRWSIWKLGQRDES